MVWKLARQQVFIWWLQAGMTSINDFATTYMCQSLPFGGVKESGFDRFAGIEGLRGLCVPKAVCEDRCMAFSSQHPLQSICVFLPQEAMCGPGLRKRSSLAVSICYHAYNYEIPLFVKNLGPGQAHICCCAP